MNSTYKPKEKSNIEEYFFIIENRLNEIERRFDKLNAKIDLGFKEINNVLYGDKEKNLLQLK